MTDRSYMVGFSWDEMDTVMAAVMRQVDYWRGRVEADGRHDFRAEVEPHIASLLSLVERMGDARRAAEGQLVVVRS